MNTEKLSIHLKSLRKENNLTQEEVAKKLCVSRKQVAMWELGYTVPSLEDLKKISDIYNISIDELLNNSSEKVGNIKNDKEIKMLYVISILLLIVIFLLLGLNDLINNILIFIILVCTLIYLGFKSFKNKKAIIFFIPILLYFLYSFFTCSGSVRLCVLTMGHPFTAYTENIKENIKLKKNNSKYFIVDNLKVVSGDAGNIRCDNFLGLKISSYYGF